MVDKYKSIIDTLEDKHGEACLFAVLKMDEFTDRWSILLSADWTQSDEQRKAVFKELAILMNHVLSPDEKEGVARVGVWPTDRHLVQDLLQYKAGTHISESTRVNGNIVHDGYILRSKLQENSSTAITSNAKD